jgi:L-lactate dehydrogenase complex protein LldG
VPEHNARETILGNIRRALLHQGGSVGGVDTADQAWARLPRSYRRRSTLNREALLDLLEDRLHDYDAGVYRCSPAQAGALIARILTERGKRRMAVPAGVDPDWLADSRDTVTFVEDAPGVVAALNGCDGVLTGATAAIAQTGSIVLQDGPGQGRRAATLLPDYHLCLVHASAVIETVPEAMARLQLTAALATTFFSGPSATADIEMTRIKGVHGPRFVDVIVLLDEAATPCKDG